MVTKPCTGVQCRRETVVSNEDGASVEVAIVEVIVLVMNDKDRERRDGSPQAAGESMLDGYPRSGAQRKMILNVGVKLATDHARSEAEMDHDLLE